MDCGPALQVDAQQQTIQESMQLVEELRIAKDVAENVRTQSQQQASALQAAEAALRSQLQEARDEARHMTLRLQGSDQQVWLGAWGRMGSRRA